mgnify:CR=1 FL=1
MDQELLTRAENGVATITFNRPEVMNSVNPAYLYRVIDAVQKFDDDDSVRAIVLTGNGRSFCSGGDKAFLRDLTEMTPAQIRRTVYKSFLGTTRAIKLCSKPTLAALNGPAVGAGCEIAVACDFRIASSSAFFCENWVDLGIIPPLGGMYLLPRLIGLERASNMIMRATRVFAEEAKAIGLATEVVAPEALAEAARKFAEELASRPRSAIAVAKQGLRRGMEGSLAGEWEFNLQAQAMLISGPDFAEAIAAMEEKRKPAFK